MAIKTNALLNKENGVDEGRDCAIRESSFNTGGEWQCQPKSITELWKKEYKVMVVKNINHNSIIMVNRDDRGEIYRDFKNGYIQYKFVDNNFRIKSPKEYSLNRSDEKRPIWIIREAW